MGWIRLHPDHCAECCSVERLGVLLTLGVLALAGCRSSGVVESDFGEHSTAYDGRMTVTMNAPAGPGPFPAVILMHGCNGLDWGTTRGMALHVSHLVAAGFVTLVVDSYTARGFGSSCTSARKGVEATLFRQYDAVHALRHLQELPLVDPQNIFLVGMSQGGSVAARLAGRLSSIVRREEHDEDPAKPWFRAFVAYYPWCPHLPDLLDRPLLVLSGEKDDWTPSLGCFWHTAVVKGAPYDVKIYEGAHHSFDLPIRIQSFAGHTVGGHPEAAADSRERMVEWFRMHML